MTNNNDNGTDTGSNNNITNNRRNNNKKKNKKSAVPDSDKFTGKCDDLNGHIFDCNGPKQADQFIITKRELEEYIGRTFKYGKDIMVTLETLSMADIIRPSDPIGSPPSRTDTKIHDKQIDLYI